MLKKHFIPYKEVIIRSISSCISPEQLHCCHDMMDRFKDSFVLTVETNELNEALDELSAAYLQKQSKLHIY